MTHPFPSFAGQFRRLAAVVAALTCALTSGGRVQAGPAFERDFNGPETSWQLLETNTPSRIESQECVPGGARDESGAERIVAAAAAGESLFLTCPTPRVAVLSELEIRLWVKSSAASIQLATRVALPRSRDPKSRAARTVIVRGPAYDRPGHWQQLTLSGIPKLLAAELRVMRATLGATIDAKEAFVDSVVLVVPGDPRGVEVLTDHLEVDGILLADAEDVELANYVGAPRSSAATGGAITGSVRLQGGLLLVDGRPFVPRVVEWQGEPFAFLAERGLNAVQISEPPTDEQVADAERHGLWFVVAAPRPESLMRDGIGRRGDRILGWVLADEAVEGDPNYAVRWAELIRQRDTVAGRPVIVAPELDWSTAGKAADALVARHPRMHRISAEEYERWLEGRPRFARPGTPLWAGFATQFGEAVQRQAAELSTTTLAPPNVDLNRLDSLVQLACMRGVRGFIFQSDSPLSDSDAATRRRAVGLELLNRRLQLVEPWLAGGKVIGRIASADGAWTGVVLHVDRARLLVPVPASVNPVRSSPSTEVAFLVPGVPESSQAYALSPVAMQTLPLQRVAGGTRLSLPSIGDSFVLITEDPQVIQSLRQRIARDGPQIVRLERELVAQQATSMVETVRRLLQFGYSNDAAERGAAAVDAQLRQIDAQLAAGHLEQAREMAGSANRMLEQIAAEQRGSVGTPAAFDSNPLALSDEQLADYAAFRRSYESLRGGENLLYGGDFEDLGQMTQVGWRHFQQSLPDVESRVELSATQPKHGRYCLALHVAATGGDQKPGFVDEAPVWVVSPPMPVDKGQLIEITGWVRVEGPIIGDGDGLQIEDSLGGPELLVAVRRTSGWQPFRMVRAVPESTELRLTFALAGVGSAQLDAVMVRTLTPPIARRLPPATSSQSR